MLSIGVKAAVDIRRGESRARRVKNYKLDALSV